MMIGGIRCTSVPVEVIFMWAWICFGLLGRYVTWFGEEIGELNLVVSFHFNIVFQKDKL